MSPFELEAGWRSTELEAANKAPRAIRSRGGESERLHYSGRTPGKHPANSIHTSWREISATPGKSLAPATMSISTSETEPTTRMGSPPQVRLT